jgi:hypothetical protein
MPYHDPYGCGKGSRFSARKPEFADTLKKYCVQQQIAIRIEKLSFSNSCPFQAVRPNITKPDRIWNAFTTTRSRDCLTGNAIARHHRWLNSHQVIRHPIFCFASPGGPELGASGIGPTNI